MIPDLADLDLAASLVDSLFGTLYRPKPGETIPWGIADPGWREYEGPVDFYARPFREAWDVLLAGARRQSGATMQERR